MKGWLKKLRKSQQISQEETANRANISRQYYNFIESGDRRPSPQVAKRIADVLGFPNEWYRLLEPPESA